MSLQPFSISKNFIHGTEDGCLRVTAVPHITIYRIPHDFALNLTEEKELKQAGIYLLMNSTANTLYVGQADSRDNGNGVLGRMLEPHSKKKEIDQWDVGYALTSGTPTFFGATELNWLEQFFYDEALKIGRYTLLNGNRPHAGDVSFSTKMLLNSYTEFAFFLLRVELGCDAFVGKGKKPTKKAQSVKVAPASVPAPATPAVPATPAPLPPAAATAKLYLDRKSDSVHAEGVLLDDKRINVSSGSVVSQKNNLANQARQGSNDALRKQLEADGTIVNRKFTKDYIFTSVSTAATIILGTSTSGNAAWKTADGTMLGEALKSGASFAPKKLHLTARGSDAYGYSLDSGEFMVLADSKTSTDVVESLKTKPGFYNKRMDLEKDGVIKDSILTADTVFSSPSMAACVISGGSFSGAEWK